MVPPTNAQQPSLRKSVEKKVPCPSCNKLFHPNSISQHIKTKHSACLTTNNISSEHHLRSVCVDPVNGIYLIRKSFSGGDYVLHAQFKTSFPQSIKCTSSACKELCETAGRSGETGFMCIHLKSIPFSVAASSLPALGEEALKSLVYEMKWIKPERMKECKHLQEKAMLSKSALVVQFPTSSVGSSRFRHFSIFSNTPPFNRVIVTFDCATLSFTGKCCGGSYCVHRNVAKWYIKQHEPQLLRSDNILGANDLSSGDPNSSCTVIYPPNDKDISKKILGYLHSVKKIPPDLPIELTVGHSCDYKKR